MNCCEKTNYISNGIFSFDNEWDMEQCKKRYSLLKNKTFFTPNGDEEWVYQLARMEYLHRVILEYRMSGNIECIRVYRSFIDKFFRENHILKVCQIYERVRRRIRFELQLPQKINGYRTLDTAIRNYSVLLDSYKLKEWDGTDLLNNSERTRFLRELDFPMDHLRDFDYTSNWGIIIVSLNIASKAMLELDIPEMEYSILRNMLNRQIKPCGGHIECSSMYHMQIVICLMRVIFWLQRKNIPVKPFIVHNLEKMLEWVYLTCDGCGNQLMYGDSDYTNINTVLYIACRLLGITSVQPVTKDDEIELDTILLMEFLPLSGLFNRVECLNRKSEKKENKLVDGIWVYDDNSWSVRAYNEDAESGHKHVDNLSFNMLYQNRPIIMDSGRFTYFQQQKREYYRGPYAHNVSITNGGICWGIIGRWSTEYHPHHISNTITTINGFIAYCGKYEIQYGENVSRNYRCICIIEDAIVVADLIEDDKGEKLQTIHNFWVDVSPSIDGLMVSNTGLKMYCNGTVSIEPSAFSLHYNEESVGAKVINNNVFKDGIARSFVVICPETTHVKINKNGDCILNRYHLAFDERRLNGVIISIGNRGGDE